MNDNSPERSYLITGARVYTADPTRPWAEAVLTRGSRIAFVGGENETRDAAFGNLEEISMPGGLALPGLNDSHIHMTMGSYDLTILNLEGAFTVEELLGRLGRYAAENPEREWIEGYGLPYEPLTGIDRPEREVLDAVVPDRPVYVRAFDSHSSWCNTAALQRAGIERGADIPLPNEVVVDRATGKSTGMLKEKLADDIIATAIGKPDQAELDAVLCRAMGYLNGLGMTSVQNMDGDLHRLEQYERLLGRGDLSIRAYHYMSVREETPRDYLGECAGYARRFRGPWNRTGGIKLFIDGVVESKTAWMLDPYADGSADTGMPDIDPEAYRQIVLAADRLGLDVATHAIGSRGIRTAIDAYQAAAEANGPGRERRHRVEHIECAPPSDLPRFGRLGITASMQPLHAAPTTDPRFTPWTRLIGHEREPHAFNWRTLAETGATLAFGSDWPIVTPDVRAGLHAALTRTTVDGEPEGGWQPQQCLTLAQALDAYTRGAAHAERQDGDKGMLRAGMLADVTVFSHDLFRLTPREVLSVPVALTMVDGRVVHRAE
ncbi:MAG TPA: amidohydrolase [Chloroflexota bacterium]|nr:amidohydrolase [Chloroflexota bacterium]